MTHLRRYRVQPVALMLAGLYVVCVVSAVVILYQVWQSPQRTALETFGSLAVAVGGVLVGLFRMLVHRSAQEPAVDSARLGHLADELAAQVSRQWKRAASDRGLLKYDPIPVRWRAAKTALAGSTAAAAASRRFQPFPGLETVGVDLLAHGDINDLHSVYGGLGSGRLVIAGGPGSGKSSAGILLVLQALAYRDRATELQRSQIPVLMMFALEGWNPRIEPAMDWLAARMSQTCPALASKAGPELARQLIDDGLIALVLDGLDEMAEDLRPVALEVLSQQLETCRVILLTRTDERAAAAVTSAFTSAAAVELLDVDAAAAADYLLQVQLDPAPQQWLELAAGLRAHPYGPLAQALCNPLALTLVRDTFSGSAYAGQLLEFSSAASQNTSPEQVMDRLLDRVLPAAYAPRPGGRKQLYNVATATRTLSYVAILMNEDKTHDLKWWQLSDWAASAPRTVTTWLTSGLAGCLLGAVAGDAISGVGVALGASFALVVVCSVLVVITGEQAGGISRRRTDAWGPLTPVTSWRSDFRHGMRIAILAGAAAGFMVGALSATAASAAAAAIMGIDIGAAVCIATALASTTTWPVCLALTQLFMGCGTPIRLLAFLDGARKKNVLRTVGPVYQFRHARLQDRLAEQAEAAGQIPVSRASGDVLTPEAELSAGS